MESKDESSPTSNNKVKQRQFNAVVLTRLKSSSSLQQLDDKQCLEEQVNKCQPPASLNIKANGKEDKTLETMNTRLLDSSMNKITTGKVIQQLFTKSHINEVDYKASIQMKTNHQAWHDGVNKSVVDGKLFLKSKYQSANKFVVLKHNQKRGHTMNWIQDEMNDTSEFKSMVSNKVIQASNSVDNLIKYKEAMISRPPRIIKVNQASRSKLYSLEPTVADNVENSAINYNYIFQTSKDIAGYESKLKIGNLKEVKPNIENTHSQQVTDLSQKEYKIELPDDKDDRITDVIRKSIECSILDVPVPSPPSELKKSTSNNRLNQSRLLNLDPLRTGNDSPSTRENYSPLKNQSILAWPPSKSIDKDI